MASNRAFGHKPIRTADDFLEWAAQQDHKYEFVDGVIVSMAGGTDPHSRLAVRLAGRLDAQLPSGSHCRTYNSDSAVKMPNGEVYRPDVMVACEGIEELSTTAPLVVIEVLSPSTEADWRRRRLERLMEVPSLRHIVLVAQDVIRVEHFHHEGGWTSLTFEHADDRITFPEIAFAVSLREIYRNILDI